MLTPGSALGPYDIQALIGQGGMGEVYRATDTRLKRDVALKVLPATFAADADRLARFEREAQVLASLNHPHIASIYGLEESNGTKALVMELVEGPTLADRITQGPLPPDEALPIARQIAEALESAHDAGIIHRDLKPANIKLRPDGTVKVLDFGLAKAMEPPPPPAILANSPTFTSPAMMTHAGVILGTAAYMSPEQARGKPVDRRTDVWAFGCVLYEMLTGRCAFEGEDVSDTLAEVLRGTPDFSVLPRSTPPALRTLIVRCLERDHRKRVASLSTALFVLDEAIAVEAPWSRSPGTPADEGPGEAVAAMRRAMIRTRLIPVVVTLGVIAIALAVVAFRREPPPSSLVTRFSIPFPEGFSRTIGGRLAIGISNDGQTLAYLVNQQLTLRSLSEFTHRLVPVSGLRGPISTPVFSPDDRAIAFHSSGDSSVKRVAVAGGAPVTVCAARAPYGMTWHATGLIIGQGSEGIIRCSVNGGAPEQLAEVNTGELATAPQLLPDNDSLLFTVVKTENINTGSSAFDNAEVVIHSLSDGERTTLTKGNNARYLPTGHLLYTVGGVAFGVPFDLRRRQSTGEAVPVIEGVRRSGVAGTGAAHYVISNTGVLLYVPGPASAASDSWTLATADLRGNVSRLPLQPAAYDQVRVSPDGTQLVVATDDGGEAIVWTYDLQKNMPLRRLTLVGRNRFPVWHSDGRRVTFQSDREGDAGIFIQRLDDTASAERLTKAAAGESHIPEAWSPEGQHLLFAVVKDGTYRLWLYTAANRQVTAVANVESREPLSAVFSSDGRWIAYASTPREGGTPSPNRGIFVQPFPPTGARFQGPSELIDFHPAWRPNSHDIVFVPSAASGELSVVTVSNQNGVSFSAPVKGTAAVTGQRTSGMFRAWDILPDGRFVGLVSGTATQDSGSAPELKVVLNWFEELKQKVPVR